MQVSNEMVRLYKEQLGRGPTRAWTTFAGPDALLCTLEDSMTPAKRTLTSLGEHQRVRDTRLIFQHATEERFREAVERITGRTVRAFVSGTDVSEDVSSELFYLVPQERAPSRTDRSLWTRSDGRALFTWCRRPVGRCAQASSFSMR